MTLSRELNSNGGGEIEKGRLAVKGTRKCTLPVSVRHAPRLVHCHDSSLWVNIVHFLLFRLVIELSTVPHSRPVYSFRLPARQPNSQGPPVSINRSHMTPT